MTAYYDDWGNSDPHSDDSHNSVDSNGSDNFGNYIYRTRAIINRGHYCKIHFLANRCGCYSREVTIQKKNSDLKWQDLLFDFKWLAMTPSLIAS